VDRPATIFIYNYSRFDADALLGRSAGPGNTFCAPPRLADADQGRLVRRKGQLRELLSAGEPLNPEVMEQIRRAWD